MVAQPVRVSQGLIPCRGIFIFGDELKQFLLSYIIENGYKQKVEHLTYYDRWISEQV